MSRPALFKAVPTVRCGWSQVPRKRRPSFMLDEGFFFFGLSTRRKLRQKPVRVERDVSTWERKRNDLQAKDQTDPSPTVGGSRLLISCHLNQGEVFRTHSSRAKR